MKQTNVRLPEELFERLKDMAQKNHRSINKQIVMYITEGLANDDEYWWVVEEEL